MSASGREGQMAAEASAIREAMRIEHAKEKAQREAAWAATEQVPAPLIHLHKRYAGAWTVCGNDEVPFSETTERLNEATCPRCVYEGDPVPRTRALTIDKARVEAEIEDAERSADRQVNAWQARHADTPRRSAYWTIDAREADHAEAIEHDTYRTELKAELGKWARGEEPYPYVNPDDLPDPDGSNTLPIPDGPWFRQEEDRPAPMPRCTRSSDWSEPHLFEDDEIELNPEGYDEYERCERPADDPLHIEGAHAAAIREDLSRAARTQSGPFYARVRMYRTTHSVGIREGLGAVRDEDHAEALAEDASRRVARNSVFSVVRAIGDRVPVPADLNDDAAWAAYCAALPDPTEAEIAAVLAEHTGPYADRIAHCDEGFRTSARLIWQSRAAGQFGPLSYAYLRDAMSNYASVKRIYQTLSEVYALGLIRDAHIAASYESADAYSVTFGTVQ